jgi:hypothetical protein
MGRVGLEPTTLRLRKQLRVVPEAARSRPESQKPVRRRIPVAEDCGRPADPALTSANNMAVTARIGIFSLSIFRLSAQNATISDVAG